MMVSYRASMPLDRRSCNVGKLCSSIVDAVMEEVVQRDLLGNHFAVTACFIATIAFTIGRHRPPIDPTSPSFAQTRLRHQVGISLVAAARSQLDQSHQCTSEGFDHVSIQSLLYSRL